MTTQKLYKVIKNNKAKDGGDFDYTPYLPKGDKAGKWTPVIKDISLCAKGYHVTPYWNMFDCEDSQIFEVETKGLIEKKDSVGVVDKFVCESIRLVKQIKPNYKAYRNTGNKNTGNQNTGDQNTGDQNTGNWNTGDQNTGDQNTGNKNTGNKNTGNQNTGDQNTGDQNTGNHNTGSGHSGWFNTPSTPPIKLLFGKPVTEEPQFPRYFFFELEQDYKKSWKKAFTKATPEEVQQTIALENFSYAIFKEITGITKTMINKKLKEVAK